MRKIRKIVYTVLAGFAMVGAVSCSVPKDVAYFQDLDSGSIVKMAKPVPIKIKPEDKLSIMVKAKDPALADLFNLPVYTSKIGSNGVVNGTGAEVRSYSTPAGENVSSYTVTPQGNIDFPVLGSLHVEGMTRSELSGFIKGELMGRNLVKDPTVTVEFLSTGINLMGEVNRPGRYDINRDRLTILEALSLAGDLTINGQRQNVRVIRDVNGELNTYVLDLTNARQMVESPGFWLQQGDVIYVEPDKVKKRSTTVNGNNAFSASFWISVASVLTSVVTAAAIFVVK